MCGEVATIAQLLDAVANPRHEVCEAAPMILQAPSTDVIRIRKYPNRRLYDTSRSTHLTHDEVLAIVRRGLRVQISDSRTETDITNEVLLQILIARDPALVAAREAVAAVLEGWTLARAAREAPPFQIS